MSPHMSIDREAVSVFCRRHHIARLALFGSVLPDRPDRTLSRLR
jgi:predicted nucleotidyltransferase